MPRNTVAAKKRKIRVALMACGEFTGKLLRENGDYLEVYSRWLKKSLSRNSKIKPEVECYKVYADDPLPIDDEIDDCDVVLVSGSPSDAWADGPPWIPRLVNFIRHVGTNFLQVRICDKGICCGYQIVNRALSGQVDGTRQRPLEIGPTVIYTTDMGKILYGKEKLELQQFHQDHVPIESLGDFLMAGEASADYSNQGIVKFYPLDPNTDPTAEFKLHERIHILTSQGHPEFTEAIVTEIARQREEKSTITQKTIDDYLGDKGRTSEIKPMVTTGCGKQWARDYNGVQVITHAFWKMFGIEHPKDEEEDDD
ncbi:Putative glutamine amidotransferase-like protein C13C5.04 [Leucoagaricus sp. SymC.cos]|nr:Putative glutamine amidotransferase-like protein C13C5.04 [Leucoagaricus sp. SymC.cos]